MDGRVDFARLGGMNSRNHPEQLDVSTSISARNALLSRQTFEKRRGYKKATKAPAWNRSTELRGLQTGILASKVPANLSLFWDDALSATRSKITFQIRVQGIDLSAIGETDIPYSLDYNGGHERPAETSLLITPAGGGCSNYTIFKRTTEPMGFEQADTKLWKPNYASATNRYDDTTVGKMYPWLPGNTSAISAAQAAAAKPKMACVFGTGPLREFPLWHRNNSQKAWVASGVPAWTNPYFDTAGNPKWPAPFALVGTNAPGGTGVRGGYCDAGDLYIFYVWSPFTLQWHLMVLWEYSDPGIDGTTGFNKSGMQRMFAFAGWGQTGTDVVAVGVDPTLAQTITVSIERDFAAAANTRLEIGVGSGSYGEQLSQPKPGPGSAVATDPAAPFFGLREISGLVGVNGFRNKPEWRGRTMYLGGLPKMTNQRGVYGYGCGQSVNRGGNIGVTCPFPGRYSEFRMYAGAFKHNGASDAGGSPDTGVLLAASSGLAPPNSRAIKRKAAGAAWDPAQDPGVTKYTGTVNIWRLAEDDGDVFQPLYKLAGTTIETGFKTGGLAGSGNFAQDFHPFEAISNGALITRGTVGANSGALRFNGGSPAFSLAAARFRKDQGESSEDADGEVKSSLGNLRPPLEECFGILYRPHTAPELEPTSVAGSGAGNLPFPANTHPQQGEVHTLLQVMSPNREGKTSTTWPAGGYGKDELGFTQGFTQGFDHPDSIWSGSLPGGGEDCGYKQKPPGRKDMEIARCDLVAHKVSTVVGVPVEDELRRCYVIRTDFGRGAKFENYKLDPSNATAKGVARQQRGNEKFFRAIGTKGAPVQDKPQDQDDDYWFLDADAIGDDSFCFVTLCDAAGNVLTKPKDIEGRQYAIFFGYQTNPALGDTAPVVGKQTLRVYDVTNPLSIFECIPTAANAKRRIADCGLSWAASELFGKDKYIVSLGGKVQPQAGEWWLGASVYPSPIDPDHYPYGCWALGTNPDTAVDPRSLAAGSGMCCNGAKGTIDAAFEFRLNVSDKVILNFLGKLLNGTVAWKSLVPDDAAAVVRDVLRSAWLADFNGGAIVADSIGGMNMGLDDLVPLEITTGKVQSSATSNTNLGFPSEIVVHKNLPYTYNKSVNGRMFPDRLMPVKLTNTGRGDSTFGDDDFTDVALSKWVSGGLQPEPTNVQPDKEQLLAVLGHVGGLGRTDVVVVSKTAILKYDKAGAGSLARFFPLPRHFSTDVPVSRDVASGRTLLVNGSGVPIIIDEKGRPISDEFIDPPAYAVPVIWARDLTTAEKGVPPATDPLYFPLEYNVAYETVFPKSEAVLGIERIEALTGLSWTGEMPSIGTGPFGPTKINASGVGLELLQWSFFITYWSEPLQSESMPGRVFTWSNGLPKRVSTYGVGAPGSNPDDPFTGEPKGGDLQLVMRGSNPADYPTHPNKGAPKSYQLRLHNVPLSPHPDVTHIRVYRTTGNGGVFFLEQEVPVAAGQGAKGQKISILIGTVKDTSLLQPHVGGVASRVPPGAQFTATYQGRTYYFGFPWAPLRVYASYVGRPTAVPFFYYVELSGAGPGPITGGIVDNDRLYLFKEDAVYIGISREWDIFDLSQLRGGLPFSFELTQGEAGTVAQRAIASVPDKGLVYAGDASVYLQSGMQLLRVSAPIDGIHSDDYDPSKDEDALDQSRVLYPFCLDNTKRQSWKIAYHAPIRAVILCGPGGDFSQPALVLFVDVLEWAFWTGFAWDDMEAISRYLSEAAELWAIRDNRLWRLDEGSADGLDYFCESLEGQAFVNGATRLTEGLLTAIGTHTVANDQYTLNIAVASLPAPYQALITTDTSDRRNNDLLRSVFITVIDPVTDLSKFSRRIRFAYSDGTNIRVVLNSNEVPAAPSVNDKFRLGTIDAHWTRTKLKPTAGETMVQASRLFLQKGSRKDTLLGNDFRGGVDVFLDYTSDWPTTKRASFAGSASKRYACGGFKGAGNEFSLMLVSKGAYAPIELVRGSMLMKLMSGSGTLGG